MDPTLLKPSKAAEILNISPRTLETWRRKGIGPPHIAYGSRCIRYDERQVSSWLAEKAKASRK